MRAALMRAPGTAEIDVFADRVPAKHLLSAAGPGTRVHLHQVGTPAANLAIVALEPGTVGASAGRVVVRSFSDTPQICQIAVDLDGQIVLNTTMVLEPRGQTVLPFGPLTQGGVVQARIVTGDALDADNRRWALAPGDKPDKALVMSPSPEARDDLARVLLAVNQNLIVTAIDPVKFDLAQRPALSPGRSRRRLRPRHQGRRAPDHLSTTLARAFAATPMAIACRGHRGNSRDARARRRRAA